MESVCVQNSLTIGAVYTPYRWARFAIERSGLFDDWLAGKTIFDPTMGEGALLSALVDYGLEQGYALSALPAANLFGLELNATAYRNALDRFAHTYGVDMKDNFYNADIFLFNEKVFDVVFGNPPWCNFVDLPAEYKDFAKKLFFEYGLVDNPQSLLLGGSRIDIAALVIQKCIYRNLIPNGKAVFFLPLSLFLNEGAHTGFRRFTINGAPYSLHSLYDFANLEVFANIATRYGLAFFEKQYARPESIPYYRYEKDVWTEYRAMPQRVGGSFLVSHKSDCITVPKIQVSHGEKPRQGVNPCGARDVFVFTQYEELDALQCRVNGAYLLPKKYVYPLITRNNFKGSTIPEKWVLLPYNDKTGKPLGALELTEAPLLQAYLAGFKEVLSNRKGAMLQAYIRRGIWWALLGVGRYSFLQYKIVWEAYGKTSFRPQLFTGGWQANQSLQAFIPCSEKSRAEHILAQMSDPAFERYLLASKMEGTMNWAQPGRVSSMLEFMDR